MSCFVFVYLFFDDGKVINLMFNTHKLLSFLPAAKPGRQVNESLPPSDSHKRQLHLLIGEWRSRQLVAFHFFLWCEKSHLIKLPQTPVCLPAGLASVYSRCLKESLPVCVCDAKTQPLSLPLSLSSTPALNHPISHSPSDALFRRKTPRQVRLNTFHQVARTYLWLQRRRPLRVDARSLYIAAAGCPSRCFFATPRFSILLQDSLMS